MFTVLGPAPDLSVWTDFVGESWKTTTTRWRLTLAKAVEAAAAFTDPRGGTGGGCRTTEKSGICFWGHRKKSAKKLFSRVKTRTRNVLYLHLWWNFNWDGFACFLFFLSFSQAALENVNDAIYFFGMCVCVWVCKCLGGCVVRLWVGVRACIWWSYVSMSVYLHIWVWECECEYGVGVCVVWMWVCVNVYVVSICKRVREHMSNGSMWVLVCGCEFRRVKYQYGWPPCPYWLGISSFNTNWEFFFIFKTT